MGEARRWVIALFVVLATSQGAVRASTPGPEPALESSETCLPVSPAAADQRVRCTFDVWGLVRDESGFPVQYATVTDGRETATTDARGFYDLHQAVPHALQLQVVAPGGCHAAREVIPDPAAELTDGGFRQDVRLPCTPPTYNAFGFGAVLHGQLVAIARGGLRHAGQNGEIKMYSRSGDRPDQPQLVSSSGHDDRDAAGGLTKTGALVVFYARFDVTVARWSGIGYLRMSKDGTTSGRIEPGDNQAYSPYGPLVVLPSGRLMQTMYGFDGRTWRVYTTFSGDDGFTWSRLTPIDVSPPFAPTEAAAVSLGGASDQTATILLVARAAGGVVPHRWHALVQYVSRDGGRTWERRGVIQRTQTRLESMPWLLVLPGGRIALVWVDRGTLQLQRMIAPVADAIRGAWSPPAVVYRSDVSHSPHPDIGDFGYPSIVSYGPRDDQKWIVFNDVDPSGSAAYYNDVDLYMVPLMAGPSTPPIAISP